MSQTIDNRIVEMQFENKQFESGVQESLSTLDKLKKALKFDDASKNLMEFSKATKQFNLNDIGTNVEKIGDKFSAFGAVGFTALQRLTNAAIDAGGKIFSALNAPIQQIKSGGWTRAMNIENAKFQLEGLKVAWESVYDDIDYAVSGTAYGLDAAAKAASQLTASGVKAGDSMKTALRGISGVAAMANSSYEEISPIFTTVAGQGKLMTMQLRQLESRGLNAAAELGKALGKSEQEVREMVTKGKIDFDTFAKAMDDAFGEHAKDANKTFTGAMSNIKAALSRIGAEFATPLIHGAIPVFNEVRLFVNDLKKSMTPIFEVFSNITSIVSDKLVNKIRVLRTSLFELGGIVPIGNSLRNIFEAIFRVIAGVKVAFDSVFPKTKSFSDSLNSTTTTIEKFTSKLIMSDNALVTFSNIMKIVFLLIKKLGEGVKYLLTLVKPALTYALNIVGVIAKVIIYIGQLISNLDIFKKLVADIKQSGNVFIYIIEKLKIAFYNLHAILSDTSTVTGQVVLKIKNAVSTIVYVIAVLLYSAFMKLKQILSTFDTKDPLGFLVKSAKNLINNFKDLPIIEKIMYGIQFSINAVSGTIEKIIGLFNKLKNAITSFFDSLLGKERVIETTVEKPMAYAANQMDITIKHLEKGKTPAEQIASSFDKAQFSIRGFAEAIRNKLSDIKVGEVLLFSFGAAAVYLALKAAKLFSAVTSLTGGIKEFLGSLSNAISNFGKKHSTFLQIMTGIALGIGTLAAALWTLSNIPTEKLIEVTTALGALLTVIGLFSTLGSALAKGSNSFAVSMVAFSGGILILTGALIALDKVKLENVKQDVIALVAICGSLMVISAVLSKVAPSFSKGGLAILAFSGGIYILAQALSVIADAKLENLQNVWKELTIIILSFAAFAATVSKVGLASALGLLGFIAVFKLLINNLDDTKKYSIAIKKAFEYISNLLKSAVEYFYNALQKVANDIEKSKSLGIVIGAGIAAIVAIMVSIGNAGKGFKKFASGIAIIVTSIAGLTYIVVKISELMTEANSVNLDKAISMINKVFIFIGVIMALSSLPGKISKENGDKKFSYESSNSLIKDIRKLLTSMSLLVLSIGAFSAMVGHLNDDQFERAKSALYGTLGVIGVIATLTTVLTAVASKSGKTEVSFGTFTGIVLLVGTLVGAIAALMYVFSKVSWEEDWLQLIAVAGSIIGIVTTINLILKKVAAIKAIKKDDKSVGSILAFTALISALGALFLALFTVIKEDDIQRAGIILAGLVGTVTIISLLMSHIQKSTSKNLKSAGQVKAFKNTMLSIIELLAVMSLLANSFAKMSNVNAGRMAAQAAVLVGVITAISQIALHVQKLSSSRRYSISTSSIKKIASTFSGIGILVVAIIALANTFAKMNNVDAGRMAGQATTLGLLMAELATVAVVLSKFIKTGSLLKASTGSLIILELVGILEILILLFKQIDKLGDPKALIAKTQQVILVFVELLGLEVAIGALSKTSLLKDGAIESLFLLPLIGILEILILLFKQIDKLGDPKALIAKTQQVVLVFVELIALATIVGALTYAAGLIEVGGISSLFLLPLVGILELLVLIFKQIDKLGNPKKLIRNTQQVILVFTELIALATILGALTVLLFGLPAIGGIASLFLYPLVGILDALTDVIAKINSITSKGTNISQIREIIDTLVEMLLKLVGVGTLGILAVPGLLGLAAALGIIIETLGGASEKIAKLIDSLNRLVRLSSEVTNFFNAVSNGIKAAAAAVAIGILAIASAISNGKSIIKGAASGIGDSIKEGINNKVQPLKWGLDFITLFANGMRSGKTRSLIPMLGSISSIIKAYLAHSRPTEGDLVGDNVWGYDFITLFANGMKDGIPNLNGSLTSIVDTIKNGIANIDGKEIGQFFMSSLAQGLGSKLGDVESVINYILGLFGLVDAKAKALTDFEKAASRTTQEYGYQLRTEITSIEKKLKPLQKTIDDIESKGYTAGSNLTGQLQKLTTELNTKQTQLKDLENVTLKTSEATDDLTDSLADYTSGVGDAGKATTEAKSEIESFYEKIEGAISLFDEFNKESDMSAEQVLNNMRSQIEGITEWSNQIAQLAVMGIDKGLLQKLADLGPQGYKYTSAFVSMTHDQLMQANEYYHQSLMLPSAVVSQVYSSYSLAGFNAASGFLNGFTQEDIKKATVKFTTDFLNSLTGPECFDINSPSKKTIPVGEGAAEGIDKGLRSTSVLESIKGYINYMATTMVDQYRMMLPYDTFRLIAKQITNGLSSGIREGESDVINSVTSVCDQAISRARSAFRINSPSKVFQSIGSSVDEGLAKGITDNVNMVKNSLSTTTNETIDTMRETINKASEALIDGVDDPVIKPVLDLSNVMYGSKMINSMLPGSKAISATTSIQANLQNAQSLLAQPRTVNAITDNGDVVDAINSLKDDIYSLNNSIANIKLVLDTGKTVGAMAPLMDQALYNRQVMAGRGI